jgi:murein DD-endopeptidase MepM/ murein hydrolase activator NlpD
MNPARQITTVAALALVLVASLATPAVAKPVTPNRGEGIYSMTARTCGTAATWRANAARNGITASSGYLVYLGRSYDVRCDGVTTNARRAAKSVKGWVHPLASGKRGGSCWGAARSGHSHKGVDISQPSGTRIRAVHSGRVAVVRYQAGGAGWYVAVNHGGNVYTVSMHMRSRPPVSVGQRVGTGQTIGYVGSTGASTGPHLHFEVHRGLWHQINPAPFARSHGFNVGC